MFPLGSNALTSTRIGQAASLLALVGGCASQPSQPAASAPPPPQYAQYPQQPGQYPQQPGQYPNVPPPPGGYYPNGTVPPPPTTYAPNAPPPQAPPPALPVPNTFGRDPINQVDIGWMRAQSAQILNELVAALPATSQQRVTGIPLVFDNEVGEVNAFAACDKGRSLMAISDGLLEIAAYLAQAQAYDSLFQTRKTDEYIAYIAQHQRPNQPIVKPAPEFIPSNQQADPRKITLQHQVFEEVVAFVLGHELAHHHLGHLPCTGQPGPFGSGDAARVLSSAVPLLNQPNELAADWEGTKNVLSAGARRGGNQARWTEAGGLLTMRFFAGVELDVVFAFERSHPPPNLRVPLIQQSAFYWRSTGGVGLPAPRLGG
jgi:hypothetical protein